MASSKDYNLSVSTDDSFKESTVATSTGNESQSTVDPNLDDSLSSDSYRRCLAMLQQASCDTEKFAALLMVTKLIKGEELSSKHSKKLLNAIGMGFLGRLIGTCDVPEGCPQFMFKSIGLSVLSTFIGMCYDDANLHRLIPLLAEVISNINLYEEDLTLVKEAYHCLDVIASHKAGRKALIDYEVIGSLVDAYIDENIYHDWALNILRKVVTDKDITPWEDEPEAFTRLMNHICQDFAQNQGETKFTMCEVLADIIPSMLSEFDKLYNDESIWKPLLHKGLSDILFSKLTPALRNKGLLLASVVLEVFGPSFLVEGEKGRQLLLITVHFACIEVRMSLEDKTFQESITGACHITACYSIIEEAIKFLINGAIILEEKQKQQLYSALKGAFNGVLEFLNAASLQEESMALSGNQIFISASIRVLGAWIAEETTASKEQVYSILPFLIKIAKGNFESNRSSPSRKKKANNRRVHELPDLFRFLLPGLCHLTAEDRPRQILLDVDIENLLYEYLVFLWEDGFPPTHNYSECKQFSLNVDSIITLCNILMNIVVQEIKRVKSNSIYFKLLKFIFFKVPFVTSEPKNLHLNGSLCTLGLMIFRHQYSNAQLRKVELSIYRFIQSAVRFLWDGFNVEESTDGATLVISSIYQEQWDDLVELWYLSIHTLTLLLPLVPWIVSFVMESEWPQTIIQTLSFVNSGAIEDSVKNAFEEFLITLLETSRSSKDLLVSKGAKQVVKKHDLNKLSKLL